MTTPTGAGAGAERQPLVELITSVERLTEFHEIPFPAQRDPKLLSDLAGTAVTPYEI